MAATGGDDRRRLLRHNPRAHRRVGAPGVTGQYDAIVIGGGHNGLVTAAYLAHAGWRVLVLERRGVVGGACVTEQVFPGYKVSTAAYVASLFAADIVRELGLASLGF